jgi:hypothetical protein
MAMQRDRNHVPEYRSLHPRKPSRQIVTVWPKQRPPGRAACEFLKMLPPSFKQKTLI